MQDYIPIISSTLLIIIAAGLIGKFSKSKWFGINLGRIYCPNCNLKQPLIRKPANRNQALFGGYTCSQCNTEIDKYGNEIS